MMSVNTFPANPHAWHLNASNSVLIANEGRSSEWDGHRQLVHPLVFVRTGGTQERK